MAAALGSGTRAANNRFGSLLTLDADDRVYQPRGTLGRWCLAEFAERRYDFLLAEFGTYPMLRVLKALRAENRAYWWGTTADRSNHWAKQELLEVFMPQSHQWREIVLDRGVNLCLTGIGAFRS